MLEFMYLILGRLADTITVSRWLYTLFGLIPKRIKSSLSRGIKKLLLSVMIILLLFVMSL